MEREPEISFTVSLSMLISVHLVNPRSGALLLLLLFLKFVFCFVLFFNWNDNSKKEGFNVKYKN